MPKLKVRLPKFHIKLNSALWVVFALVVLVEAFALYKYLYLNGKKQAAMPVAQEIPSVRIDFDAAKKAREWFQTRADYSLPDYELKTTQSGRENPFAEY